jgi:hypothetical protein
VNVDPERGDAVTLTQATIFWGGREGGATIPVIRVQLSAGAMWWVMRGEEFKKNASPFIAVGVGFGV